MVLEVVLVVLEVVLVLVRMVGPNHPNHPSIWNMPRYEDKVITNNAFEFKLLQNDHACSLRTEAPPPAKKMPTIRIALSCCY